MRSTGSTVISFGMVSIPIKLYKATGSHDTKFNTMHAACSSRVTQPKLFCAECDCDVERSDTLKGFEFAKGQYVTFTPDEIKSLAPEKFERLDIEAFVPADSVDPIHFEKSVFIGPGKGGDRAFNLLSGAMRSTDKVAVGRYMSRGKVYLAMIRPFQNGMIIHHLFYWDEVMNYEEVELGKDTSGNTREEEMASDLVNSLSVASFDDLDFEDEYANGVVAAIEARANKQDFVVPPAAADTAASVDLFTALQASLDAAKE